jgi:hypothetical protein
VNCRKSGIRNPIRSGKYSFRHSSFSFPGAVAIHLVQNKVGGVGGECLSAAAGYPHSFPGNGIIVNVGTMNTAAYND